MPTPVQLEKARPIIQELMAEDFVAFKGGKKKAEDVGDVAMKLVENAETEVVSVKPTIVNGASMLVSRRPTRQVTKSRRH